MFILDRHDSLSELGVERRARVDPRLRARFRCPAHGRGRAFCAGLDMEDLGEGKTFAKAKGVPVVVVDEVLGTGGGSTVTPKADPENTGKPYLFFGVAKSNTAVPTIAHELWHVAGQVNHDAAIGGAIVAGTGMGVNARYCSEMRKLP